MYTVWFHEYEDSDAPRVGGKCASLGAMMRADLPVPPGFAVTTDAFDASIRRGGIGARLVAALASLDPSDLGALALAGSVCRTSITDAGPFPECEQAIRSAYAMLCERVGQIDVPVAVRSSATAEDQPDASFAGQQDTYLWIRGADDVVNHVVLCWASLYTDRAISYRHESGYGGESVSMSVAVQQMVLPKAAGVAFTLDPTNGDRSKVVLDSAFGIGESVVSGIVTPDNWVVDKVIFEIVKRTVSAKELEVVLDGDAIVHRPLDLERSRAASLDDAEIIAVARLARRAEKHFGRPQDVEWAVADGVVHLLQSRPETVWANKKRQVTTGVGSAVDGVLASLLTPVRVRPAE